MLVQSRVEISINGKLREESLVIDLEQACDLITFKRHLLTEAKLSAKQYDRYHLSVHTFTLTDTIGNKQKIFEAVNNEWQVKSAVIEALYDGKLMRWRLEKVSGGQEEKASRRRVRLAQGSKQKAKNVIEYNASGQVVRDLLNVLHERPHYQIFPLHMPDEEFCCFCRSPTNDEDLRVKCGPVYGPIRLRGGGLNAHTHELCALWTPEIFLDDNNKFKNLAKAIKRCQKIKCTHCKERGGGLGCYVKSCSKSYHYLCAKVTNCLFVNSRFIIYCDEHRPMATEAELEEEKAEEQNEELMHYICSIQVIIQIVINQQLIWNSQMMKNLGTVLDAAMKKQCWMISDNKYLIRKSLQYQIDQGSVLEMNKQHNSGKNANHYSKVKKPQKASQQEEEYTTGGGLSTRGGMSHYGNKSKVHDYLVVEQEEEFKYTAGENEGWNGYPSNSLRPEEKIYDYQESSGYSNRRNGGPSNRGRGRGTIGSHQRRDQDPYMPDNYEGSENQARSGRGRGRGRGNSFHPHDQNFRATKSGPSQYGGGEQINRGRGKQFHQRDDQVNFHLVEQTSTYQVIKFTKQSSYQQDQQYDHRPSLDELFEDKIIQDRRSMNILNPYKDFMRPDFFQGPAFVFYREESKHNHKQKFYDDDLEGVQVQRMPMKPKPRKLSYRQDEFLQKEYYNDNVNDEKFDIKQERKRGNQFWNREGDHATGKKSYATKRYHVKGNKGTASKVPMLSKRDSAYKESNRGGKNSFKQNGGQNKESANKGSKRLNYEEYLNEKQIKQGLENGTLFEGILRVNQNNRRRAFVTVDSINVDIMVDGLIQQNRALDGDTVVIQLYDPFKWTEYTNSNNVIVGKNSIGQVQNNAFTQNGNLGYTNETAIETRVVDQEILGSTDAQNSNELKVVQKEVYRQKAEVKKVKINSPEDVLSEEKSFDEIKSEEEEKDKALYEAEDTEEEDSYEGNGFIDDEGVFSAKDESSSEEETITASAKVQEVKIKVRQLSGSNKAERLAEINSIAKDLRPMGSVKAVIKSPNREKEHLVTLKSLEKIDDSVILKLLSKSSNQKKAACSSGIYAIPVSKKLPWMTLSNIPEEFATDISQKKKPENRYYLVKMEAWNAGFIRPMCKVVSCIGEAGNLAAESLRILKQHDIWSDEYETEGQKINEKVHECLRVFTKDLDPVTGEWRIPEEELSKRLDLRLKRIFTIDPLTAKDLDDALSIDKISDTLYEIGVHIADVSYFVQQGTELDKEAQLRCTSVYFVHKVYPMLPRLLCERLCSLNPNVDRLAYSIFFRMDIRTGELDRSFTPRLCRSVINSCAKWNYQLVQDILDGKITQESQLEPQHKPVGQKFIDMRNDCFLMNEIAQKRRMKRLDNGSIMLQNREFIFSLDQQSKMPIAFNESYRMPSKFLVEEYMLLANILVAEHLFKYCRDKTLLRVHPDLDSEKKIKLKQFFDKVGLGEIDLTDSKTLSLTLEALRDKGDSSKFNVAMRKFLTCLQCAKYMCINDSEEQDYQHFGLNFQLYTHFTSPIRRYADLLVHRLVTLTLQHQEKTRDLIELMDYSNYAELCSEKSYNAKKASTQCTRLFHCLLLKSHGIRGFETLLFDMDQGTISVYIDEVNMHHKLRLRDDPRIDSVVFFEEHLTLVAHLKNTSNKDSIKEGEKKIETFKNIKSLDEFEKNFGPNEFLILRIFDKVRIRVETTTEFPLDIKCTMLFTSEDQTEYESLLAEQEAKLVQAQIKKEQQLEIAVEESENLDSEV